MTTHDHDTDPSTPGAKRPAAAYGAVVEGASADRGQADARISGTPPPGQGPRRSSPRGRPTTDPGVAPPPALLPVPEEPMGIIVPSVAEEGAPPIAGEAGPAPNTFESVDVLLEGMAREQPERSRGPEPMEANPQAAARATEHAVRPAQTSPYDEPKVIIDRPSTGHFIPPAPSARVGPPLAPKGWNQSTAPGSPSLVARILIAVLAGLMVVTVIFVALQRTSGGRTIEAAATPASVQARAGAAAAPTAATSVSVPENTVAAVVPEPSEVSPAPSASAAVATGGSRKGTTAPKPNTRQRPRTPAASKPSGVDLGEFKGAL